MSFFPSNPSYSLQKLWSSPDQWWILCPRIHLFPALHVSPTLHPKSWQFSGQMQGDGAQEMGGRQPRRKVKMEALHMRLEPHRVDKAWIQERQEPRMGCCSESCGCLSWGWSHCWTRAGCWVGSSWGSHSYIQWLQSWLSHQQSLILSPVRKNVPGVGVWPGWTQKPGSAQIQEDECSPK